MIDPISFSDNLENIPIHITLTSSDEVQMMESSNLWYDKLPGEKHISISVDTEHYLLTNLRGVLSPISAMIKSIAAGKTDRPTFNYTLDNKTGELTVMIDTKKYKPTAVYLRHAETYSTVRRDFRFLRVANEQTGPCKFPEI